MGNIRLIIFIVLLVAALVFLVVGGAVTSHRHYSRFGEVTAPYEWGDPVLIREFSFA